MNWIHTHVVIAFLASFVVGSLLGRLLEIYLMWRRLTVLLPPAFDTRNYRGIAIIEPRKHGSFFER